MNQKGLPPPPGHANDPGTGAPTSNVKRMDHILQSAWDGVMRTYATSPKPNVQKFLDKYGQFLTRSRFINGQCRVAEL